MKPSLFGVLLLTVSIAQAQSVPYPRLRASAKDPGNWLTYSGGYSAQRHSRLAELTPINVAGLRTLWSYRAKAAGAIQATPIVADGIMYLTEPPSTVTALDVRTGRPLWRWDPKLPAEVKTLGFDRTNRGVAILDSTVYVATLDAHLVALDARNGALRWRVKLAENADGYASTGAPLVLDGKVIIGISGGEAGIRGFLDAYDARTGERQWRFYTVPEPGEPGAETWAGESWRTGGGSTWVPGSFDPELNLLYWGIGNPAPDWNGDGRPGDNLYTASLVALDASTGRLRWYFQFTPHDTHDWDACQVPVLFELMVAGRTRQLVAMANRNGFYYVLDRVTGEFLRGEPYVRQNWAEGLTPAGRPVVRPGSEPSEGGTTVYPSLEGGSNWHSPAYDPVRHQFYVAAQERGSVYYKSPVEFKRGTAFMGGGQQPVDGEESWGAIRALDGLTGARKWEFALPLGTWSGLLSTAGGLVFGGASEGNVFALDARTGEPRWQFQTGGDVTGNPISFVVDGHQSIAVASGPMVFVFGLR